MIHNCANSKDRSHYATPFHIQTSQVTSREQEIQPTLSPADIVDFVDIDTSIVSTDTDFVDMDKSTVSTDTDFVEVETPEVSTSTSDESVQCLVSSLVPKLLKYSPFFRQSLTTPSSSEHTTHTSEETTTSDLVTTHVSLLHMLRILEDAGHPSPLKPLSIIERVEQLNQYYFDEIYKGISNSDPLSNSDKLKARLIALLLKQEKLGEVYPIIETISSPYYKPCSQMELVNVLLSQGNLDKARSIIATINEPYDKACAQIELVKKIKPSPESMDMNKARSFIADISNSERNPNKARVEFVKALRAQGNLHEALSVIATIDTDYRAEAQAGLFEALLSQRNLDEVRGPIATIPGPHFKASAQVEIARALTLQGNFKEARQVIAEIQDLHLKVQAQLDYYEALFINPTSIQFSSTDKSEKTFTSNLGIFQPSLPLTAKAAASLSPT